MDYPGEFSAVAAHSADMAFDTTLKPSLIDLAEGLASSRGDVEEFLSKVRQAPKLSGRQIHVLMLLGLSAIYSPNHESPLGFDLPIDLFTASLNEAVWEKWLSHDPVWRLANESATEGLQRLKCLYFDCGSQDQYWLHYGARQLEILLKKRKIEHHYEEFKDNHSSTSYRYDESLPRLLSVLC